MSTLTLRAKNLSTDGVVHAFFGRAGGVSGGIFASLNCGPGSGDDLNAVAENRALAMQALSANPNAKLVTIHQTHSPNAVIVAQPWTLEARPKADGMVTDRPDITLGILTADCAPVLLADADAGVIGAAHAGWKGAIGGILEQTISSMKKLGARETDIHAAIGPCISQAAYEVGPEFIDRFRDADPASSSFFVPSPRPNHWQFDLEAYVASRLGQAGIGQIEKLSLCTYAREGEFFSYRRATHRGESGYGRQLSAIMLSG